MFKKIVRKKLALLIVVPIAWFTVVSALIVFIISFLIVSNNSLLKPTLKYSIFSSRPLVLGTSTTRLLGTDPRAAKIDKVLEYFKCPMRDLGESYVQEAEKNGIPYWIVPAIGFQESSCGKNSPTIDGNETYNAWGWGVWGDETKGFDSWEHGISVVSKYIGERFFSQGITDPCEIMKTYTPPSSGSWCEGVKYFGEIIENYKSPTT